MKNRKKFFVANIKECVTVFMILLLFLIAGLIKSDVFTSGQLPDIIKSILLWTPLIVTVAMGMMMVIIIGDIDLSVGAIVALSIMSAGLIQKAVALPLLVTLLISVVVGVLCGMVNGFLIAFLRIPSIIVTLGTMNAFRGLTFLISEGKQITSSELPDKIDNIIRTGINLGSFQLPWIVVITFVLVVFFYFFLTQTHTGREVYAVGSNWTAAYLRGIKCKRIQFLVFAITGALCGAAGYMYAARYGYINPSNTGNGIEFVVISATIIGGVGVNGGSGNVFGVYLGCILLASLNTLISVTGIPGTVQKFCYGLIILIALLVDLAVKVMQDKRRLKELIEKERIKV